MTHGVPTLSCCSFVYFHALLGPHPSAGCKNGLFVGGISGIETETEDLRDCGGEVSDLRREDMVVVVEVVRINVEERRGGRAG